VPPSCVRKARQREKNGTCYMEGNLGLRLWANQWKPAALGKIVCHCEKEDAV